MQFSMPKSYYRTPGLSDDELEDEPKHLEDGALHQQEHAVGQLEEDDVEENVDEEE